MGKGSKRRKGSDQGKFDSGHDKVDWNKKGYEERESKPNKKGGVTIKY